MSVTDSGGALPGTPMHLGMASELDSLPTLESRSPSQRPGLLIWDAEANDIYCERGA